MSLQDASSLSVETIGAETIRQRPTQATWGTKTRQRTNSTAATKASSFEMAFQQLVNAIKRQLKAHKNVQFTVSLAGEDTEFVRFNSSQVRQTGHVQDGQVVITLIASNQSTKSQSTKSPSSHSTQNDPLVQQTNSITLPFVGEFAKDWAIAQPALNALQAELTSLPHDAYAVSPTSYPNRAADAQSREVNTGNLLPTNQLVDTLLNPIANLDFSGLYAGGSTYRAYADSAGRAHWFETPSFTLDYSLFGKQAHQAVKGTLAGKEWQNNAYADNIAATAHQLELLSKPVKAVPKGRYRTYLAPAAVADIVDAIIWGGGLGEATLRQGNSAFSKLEQGDVQLSEKFSLGEDFHRVAIPRFNEAGEIAPAQLSIIEKGRWASSLINGRSAKEYGKVSNGANAEEAMRAPVVAAGSLDEVDVLAALGTGLYLSNLHYLNWSDLSAGRITGMTRYACFWVEDGEIVAPIENLRFDDDLYRFLGPGLLALTRQQRFLPAVGTYDRRSLGGMWMPGMLIDQFRYTL